MWKVIFRFNYTMQYMDRTPPLDKHLSVLAEKYGIAASPITPQMFASAGKEHMEKYGRYYMYV